MPGSQFLFKGLANQATRPVGTTQTFNSGDFLTLTSGAAAIAAAAGNDVGGGTLILGRSTTPTVSSLPPSNSGLSDTSITFIMPTEQTEFALRLFDDTAGDTVATPATQDGATYGLTNDSTYGWCVNLDDTTNDKVRITGFIDLYTWPRATTAGTDQYAWVWAKVLSSQAVLSYARAAT